MSFHASDPSALLEATFQRIERERWAGMPMLNPTLAVAAVGFERKENEWRGVLVTPWGINLLLLPATADWARPASHERTFRQYAAGSFAFLGNHEDGLGNYLTCPLIHSVSHFVDQETAVMTARACLIALDMAPPVPEVPPRDPEAPESPARRGFFTGQRT
ncbi:MAG: [NiFe]-hydrogenase assembly chaperone HybE [Rhodocyclaceae bacterium]|nr:[NiFe]-hydrogenase assembly chaperone HybE [Rhodocyclaceae bacterium]MDZ4215369.1 [NiFe]-hydrogenase assembly chaperone HybE [Rhodocyclaceae bacterium]